MSEKVYEIELTTEELLLLRAILLERYHVNPGNDKETIEELLMKATKALFPPRSQDAA